MLPAMAPNPVFSCARTNRSARAPAELKPSISDFECSRKSSVYLFGVSPNGGVNLETEFPIPNRSNPLQAKSWGRVAGFAPGSHAIDVFSGGCKEARMHCLGKFQGTFHLQWTYEKTHIW